jgi:hypothetical protein
VSVALEVGAVSCLQDPPCAIVVTGTDGAATVGRRAEVGFDLDVPVVVSPSAGLTDGQSVVVTGRLGAASAPYKLRRCATRNEVTACTRGRLARTLADGTYRRDVVVRKSVNAGAGPISCIRHACRFEVLQGGVVFGAAPYTFAPPG